MIFIGSKKSYGTTSPDKLSVGTSNDRPGAELWYRYLTWAMEQAGPSFIKLGQWAASRTDIFPDLLTTEMSKLHSNSTPHNIDSTIKIIEESFDGKKFEEIFEEFIPEPIGVGAIAQVYKAKIANSSHDWVAVKVLHPGVVKTVERDLSIMRFFANIINLLPTMEWLSLPGEVETFAQMMRLQMDLRIEASNLEIFRNNFAGRSDIKFPRPFLKHSSRQVLIEEFINAIPMDVILRNSSGGQNKMERLISGKGLDAFLKMLLLDNFIHADLHPGNIYVRFHGYGDQDDNVNAITREMLLIKDHDKWQAKLDDLWEKGFQPQICFIDVGLVTELNKNNRRNFLDLFKAIAEFDGYRVGELMIERSRTPETAIDADFFALKTQRLVQNIKRRTFALGNVKVGDLLSQMLSMVRSHHVRMESDFITVVLSILLLEGIGRQLDPGMDLFKSSIPILRELSSQERGNPFDDDVLSMVKVWLALETRQFINASIQDIHNLVKYDLLCPNR
ncbi:uncharacterized protein SAPINGB_P003312 [Magnusiomyces paraingens]|uniref:Protein kinase domain-containing protein n=1 Tax=Magnusiomyces paraingens TaxID=2606893 RepID=A0A5E8BTQ5_9ASCO|nr:uncharacterized protein SAPINGB_P003312 [Saprochaete ingens]VVT52085.1 unnamed protein product [Saprochaete ingens]